MRQTSESFLDTCLQIKLLEAYEEAYSQLGMFHRNALDQVKIKIDYGIPDVGFTIGEESFLHINPVEFLNCPSYKRAILLGREAAHLMYFSRKRKANHFSFLNKIAE